MNRIEVSRAINAPVSVVFATVADIQNFSKAIPHIVGVEILSETQSGVGTRFRETRSTRGREHTTELEGTEFVENEHVRIVADSNGAVWDSVFRVHARDGCSELEMTMDARPYKVLAKITTPFISRFIRKAVEADMDAVKTHCEAQTSYRRGPSAPRAPTRGGPPGSPRMPARVRRACS